MKEGYEIMIAAHEKTEIDQLITWAERMVSYMGIAVQAAENEKLADIVIDRQDQETMEKITNILKQMIFYLCDPEKNTECKK